VTQYKQTYKKTSYIPEGKTVFINQHYWPDVAATGQNLTDLAEFLAERYHEVCIITSRGKYESGHQEVPMRETHNGVEIYRVPATSFGRDSNIGRIIDYATFMIMAAMVMVRNMSSVQSVCTLTTPPFIGVLGLMAERFFGKTHIIWSMDLHPEAEIQLGMISESSRLATFLKKINTAVINSAACIVSLGPEMTAKLIENCNADPNLIKEIKIWSDGKGITPQPKKYALDMLPEVFQNRFIVQYSGNMGLVHEFETMCRVIERFKGDDSIGFVFQGDGPRKSEVAEFILSNDIENVLFLPYVPLSELSSSLAKADVHWLSLRPKLTGVAVPAKTYGYMASGRPVLLVGKRNSDSGFDIAAANCGKIVQPGKVDQLERYIRELKLNEELRESLGQNGRNYFEEHADKEVCCRQWANLLASLHTQKPPFSPIREKNYAEAQA